MSKKIPTKPTLRVKCVWNKLSPCYNLPDIAITFAATAVAKGAAKLVPFAMK